MTDHDVVDAFYTRYVSPSHDSRSVPNVPVAYLYAQYRSLALRVASTIRNLRLVLILCTLPMLLMYVP